MPNSTRSSVESGTPADRPEARSSLRRRIKALLLCAALGAAMFLGVGGIGAPHAHAHAATMAPVIAADNGTGGPTAP